MTGSCERYLMDFDDESRAWPKDPTADDSRFSEIRATYLFSSIKCAHGYRGDLARRRRSGRILQRLNRNKTKEAGGKQEEERQKVTKKQTICPVSAYAAAL